MFRARLPRGTLLGAAAVASFSGSSQPREKLPIYPPPEPELVLVETPTELERRIGVARRTVTSTFQDTHTHVQGWVSRWIGVEHAIERRVKSLIPPDEPLTPGLLYVGVASLTGSVVARSRMLPLRILLPPALFVLSLDYFLPKTTSNVADYLSSLEHKYFPRVAQTHDTARAHTAMTWDMAKDVYARGRERLAGGVDGAVTQLQGATGLKLRDALGWGQGVVKTAESRGKELTQAVEEHVEDAKGFVDQKVDDVKRIV